MPYGQRCPTEDEEQSCVIEWARWTSLARASTHGCLALLHANMNASKRSYATAYWAQRQGMKPGVPDLFLPVPMGPYHGLFIEMKRLKGGKLSAEQLWWASMLRAQGYLVECCRGAERAIGCLEDYLAMGVSSERNSDDLQGHSVPVAAGGNVGGVLRSS